jgi:hypothetical protein
MALFSLSRLFGARSKLERAWADTQVNSPDTVPFFNETDRAALAESEWFTESLGLDMSAESK